jgi:hypothetical protein
MRQGKKYFWGMTLATTAVAIGGAAPAAADKGGCIANAPSGAETVAQSGQAIVLSAHGKLWGCSYGRERVHELPGQDTGNRIMRGSVVVRNRYAAYGSKLTSGHHTITVYSVKLWSGRPWAASDDLGVGDDVSLTGLVLRGNGSIAWMFSYRYHEADGWTQVLGFDHDGNGDPQTLDGDNDQDSEHGRLHRIIAGSLRLTHLGSDWRVTWSRRGESTKSEPID